MRTAKLISVLACAAAVALPAAGCSPFDDESDQIPSEKADAMLDTLNAINEANLARECDRAEENAEQLVTQAEEAPVGGNVGDELEQAAQRLQDLVLSDCADTGATGAEDEVSKPPASGEPETEETTPPPTEETTPTEDQTQTDGGADEGGAGDTGAGADGSETTEQPPSDGGGNPPAGTEGNPNQPPTGGTGTGGTGVGEGGQ